MKKIALFLFCNLFFMPASVMAMETLSFKDANSYKEKQIIDFIRQNKKKTDISYSLAAIDLNDDAIDEYIVKPTNLSDCPEKPLCPQQIIAFKDRVPISLGEFDAHKMLISYKKTYGIRQIIVYNIPYNDFKSDTAIWSPFNAQFELP